MIEVSADTATSWHALVLLQTLWGCGGGGVQKELLTCQICFIKDPCQEDFSR